MGMIPKKVVTAPLTVAEPRVFTAAAARSDLRSRDVHTALNPAQSHELYISPTAYQPVRVSKAPLIGPFIGPFNRSIQSVHSIGPLVHSPVHSSVHSIGPLVHSLAVCFKGASRHQVSDRVSDRTEQQHVLCHS